MDDHVDYLRSIGVSSVSLSNLKEGEAGKVKNGEYSVIYGSPESWLKNQRWRELLSSALFKEKLCCIAVDEAHVIKQWGTSSTNKMVAFRTIYSELHELRTLAAGAKVIALTATATLSTKETITDVLRMQDFIEINENPNKKNITYIVKYLSNSMDAKESFKWLVNEINERKDGGDKTIIYCQTIKQCSLVYGTLRSMLIELVANGKPKLEMLHSCTPKQNKDAILESFKRLDGHVQVLVATIAFGMGIGCKGVHRTIHFGPSKNCEAFIQENGRAGRDGKSSFSYLLYKGIMLNHVERDIK
ncbi:predicted protein [Nematostella vectensis]|uniref:DNA 3'-5' helicase n=1 Tax=Nematostella vectensis TaxID=45351 RepID=A7S723_NEMVE|nr:predicted protein [Nematostella vectensis]|eukprot:XP_001632480.1 predicted protein [Nematostella vectensis]